MGRLSTRRRLSQNSLSPRSSIQSWRETYDTRFLGLRTKRNYLLFFSSFSAAWYFFLMSSMFTVGAGNFMFSDSRVSTRICDTARLRNHLWLEGMIYHGA